jgi:hypothetical protein
MAVLWLSFVVVCHTPSLVLSLPILWWFSFIRFPFAQLIITTTFI